MGKCCGKKGKVWNPEGGNYCCGFCGKGMTEDEVMLDDQVIDDG